MSVFHLLNELGVAEILGIIGALFFIATNWMKTMIPLRIAGIISNAFFLAFGILTRSYPTIVLYLVLFPLNCVRLRQMIVLVRKVQHASDGDLSMDWLKPFMSKRQYRKGDLLFSKGDAADEMFYVVTGRFVVVEINQAVLPGNLIGELAFVVPDQRRTQTVRCEDSGTVLTIPYDKVRELYFQNPSFGFYFLRVASERLLQNAARADVAGLDMTPPPSSGNEPHAPR